jgi:hypothetical protein
VLNDNATGHISMGSISRKALVERLAPTEFLYHLIVLDVGMGIEPPTFRPRRT